MANEPSSGCPGRVLVPLDTRKHPESRSDLNKFAVGVLRTSIKVRTFQSTIKVSARHFRTTHRCPQRRSRSIMHTCDPLNPHAAILV